MKNCENRILKEATLKLDIYSLIARVAELADALDLGSSTVRCGGSTPPSRIQLQNVSYQSALACHHT